MSRYLEQAISLAEHNREVASAYALIAAAEALERIAHVLEDGSVQVVHR